MSLRNSFITNFVGEHIGNYRLAYLLAEGGFSTVYLGTHVLVTDYQVVIKVLLDKYIHSQREYKRFLQEAKILHCANHRHVLSIIDFGMYQDHPYIVLPYLPNGTLEDRLQSGPSLTIKEIETILFQIGLALIHLHQLDIVHCDVKPSNIFFDAQNRAVLADFNNAEILTGESLLRDDIRGSFDYMSPEQFKKIVSKKSDQYAFGCLAYRLCTGHLPFPAQSLHELLYKQHNEDPIRPCVYNPSIPAYIEKAILKAIAKQSDQRHESVEAFMWASGLLTPKNGRRAMLGKTKEQWFSMGFVHHNTGNYAAAVEAFNQAIRLDARWAKALYGKGLALLKLNSYSGALESFAVSIQCNPQFAKAYNGRGKVLCCLGQYVEAIAAYDQAIRINPSYAIAFYNKGIALHCLGMHKKAWRMQKRARELGFNK